MGIVCITIWKCRSKNIQKILSKEERKMKKLFSLLFLVVLLVAGACTSTPEPTPPPVVQQPTEVPTEEIIPTEEMEPPVELTEPKPTEEPESIPAVCPSTEITVATPEDLFIDLGEFSFEAEKVVYAGDISALTISVREPEALMKEGGNFTFTMPSPGFIYLGPNSAVTIDGESWGGQGIASKEGEFLVPQGAMIKVETNGEEFPPNTILDITFISGETIPLEEIEQEEIPSSVVCNSQGLWEFTIKNEGKEDLLFPVNTSKTLLIKTFEGLKKAIYPWGETPGESIKIGFTLFEGDQLILSPGGEITFLIFGLYPAE